MGMIIAKFRKKKSTYDQLEQLDSQIKSIEEYGKSTEIKQRKVAGRFMLISVLVYVFTSIIFYFYFFPETVYERVVYVIPLITAPLVIVSVKRILTWWYNRKLKRNLDKLSTLKEEKKKMLDGVMETETYKVAKKILEKFAPDEVIIRKSPNSSSSTQNIISLPSSRQPVGLRYRGINTVLGKENLTPRVSDKFDLPITSTPNFRPNLNFGTTNRSLVPQTPRPPAPMARGILPKDRSALEKLVDYLVGDGPSNRYALICKQCYSHNGMALREEFEYLSFHCCYCQTFNAAKKQRPPAPKLGIASRRLSPNHSFKDDIARSSSTSESEKNSADESEIEEEINNKTVENNIANEDKKEKDENVAMSESMEVEQINEGKEEVQKD